MSTGGATNSDPTVCKPTGSIAAGTMCGPSGATCNSATFASTTNQTYCAHDSWTCVACTSNDSACVTNNCSDCCSSVFTDGKCIAGPCKNAGSACSGSDCKDCCSGLVGFDGKCVQCNANSDCPCPKACMNHQCVCTPNNQPCAYPGKGCQDCCSSISASRQCTCIPSGVNQVSGTDMTMGGIELDGGTYTVTFKFASFPGAAAACCSGQASSQTSCQ